MSNIISIDIDKLIKLGVSLDGYLLLHCLHKKNKELITNYIQNCGKIQKEYIDSLLENSYIISEGSTSNYLFSNLKLTEKAKENFFEGVDDWIETWYNLWPKGVKSGGYLIRADMEACLKKMKSFVEKNPHYSKGIIIASTKKYLDDMKKDGYSYCKISHYFIKKDGSSVLAGICEQMYDIVTNGKDDVKQDKRTGGTEAI